MAPLGIVDHVAAPRFDHPGQHVGKFRPADARFRENFRVVAADVFDYVERFTRLGVDEQVFGFGRDLFAVVENDIRRVREAFGFLEFAAGRLVEVFARLLFHFGEVVPHFERFGVDAERGDARRDEIFVSRFGHQRELACHDRHDRFQRYDVAVVADTGTGSVLRVFADIPAQVVPDDVQESRLRTREKILADAAARIIIAVVGNIFLVIFPGGFHRPFIC